MLPCPVRKRKRSRSWITGRGFIAVLLDGAWRLWTGVGGTGRYRYHRYPGPATTVFTLVEAVLAAQRNKQRARIVVRFSKQRTQ